jgi:hypothetical protein
MSLLSNLYTLTVLKPLNLRTNLTWSKIYDIIYKKENIYKMEVLNGYELCSKNSFIC